MDTSNISASVQSHVNEAKLRGIYLSITVDIDFMLIMLIHECFKPNLSEIETYYFHKNGKGKDLCELTMFERLDVCQQGLDKYHSESYQKHKESFTSADTLRKIRNKFAHDKIDNHISPNDTTKLTFHKLRKNLMVEMKEYSIADLYKELDEYKNTGQELLRLISKVMGYPEPVF
jgi:hypothetical protein